MVWSQDLFLPPYEAVTYAHLQEVLKDKRKRIQQDQVKYKTIPHYEGLTVKDILEFGELYPDFTNALPSRQLEIDKLPRDYLNQVPVSCLS